jgi:hypothetical protein
LVRCQGRTDEEDEDEDKDREAQNGMYDRTRASGGCENGMMSRLRMDGSNEDRNGGERERDSWCRHSRVVQVPCFGRAVPTGVLVATVVEKNVTRSPGGRMVGGRMASEVVMGSPSPLYCLKQWM